MIDPLAQLMWRVEDDRRDDEARVEIETLLRSRSPGDCRVRFLELDRRLAATPGESEQFSSLLRELGELVKTEFSWDDRMFLYLMPRRFDLWLDYFAPNLRLATANALRIYCGLSLDEYSFTAPLTIARDGHALDLDLKRQAVAAFICEYERREEVKRELPRGEIQMTIRPVSLPAKK